MTALDLRPLSLGELLDRTFFLYRRNFLLFTGIAAIPYSLCLVMNLGSYSSDWISLQVRLCAAPVHPRPAAVSECVRSDLRHWLVASFFPSVQASSRSPRSLPGRPTSIHAIPSPASGGRVLHDVRCDDFEHADRIWWIPSANHSRHHSRLPHPASQRPRPCSKTSGRSTQSVEVLSSRKVSPAAPS